jgi:sec-independent protein translocase protein TatA
MRAGFWEILLIVVLVLILFGHSKIPELAKNIANGINIFKKELKSNGKDESGKLKSEGGDAAPVKPVVKKAPVKKSAKPAARKVAKPAVKKTSAKK